MIREEYNVEGVYDKPLFAFIHAAATQKQNTILITNNNKLAELIAKIYDMIIMHEPPVSARNVVLFDVDTHVIRPYINNYKGFVVIHTYGEIDDKVGVKANAVYLDPISVSKDIIIPVSNTKPKTTNIKIDELGVAMLNEISQVVPNAKVANLAKYTFIVEDGTLLSDFIKEFYFLLAYNDYSYELIKEIISKY